jgi:hypothetical protein
MAGGHDAGFDPGGTFTFALQKELTHDEQFCPNKRL